MHYSSCRVLSTLNPYRAFQDRQSQKQVQKHRNFANAASICCMGFSLPHFWTVSVLIAILDQAVM